MKKAYLLLLTLSATNVYAAAPVLDGSYYETPYAAPVVDSLYKLQQDVASLKTKVAALTTRQNKLESLLAGAAPRTTSPYVASNYNPGATATLDEKARYQRAYSILKSGGYDQAIAEFQAIISTYPAGEYSDNSQYWIGEALLKKGDKQSAMRAFDRVVQSYSRSPKVPDALLKLGMTQTSMGNKAKARDYYDYLISTYPGTASANNAYIKRSGL